MPKAVSNSSPLIHLAASGNFALLHEFYEEVWIPPAVWREVVEEGRQRPGAAEVRDAAEQGWTRVVSLHDDLLVKSLRRELDEGEAEAIALAVQERPDIVLLDETEARQAAQVYGLMKTGVVGLLIRARLHGKVAALRDELDRLRDEAGFWIDDSLYHAALEAAGEAK